MYTPPMAVALLEDPLLPFTWVCVYSPVTSDGLTNNDSLFETLTVAPIICTKLSGVTCPFVQVMGIVFGVVGEPFEDAWTVQTVRVVMSAEALELGVLFCAEAIPESRTKPRHVRTTESDRLAIIGTSHREGSNSPGRLRWCRSQKLLVDGVILGQAST